MIAILALLSALAAAVPTPPVRAQTDLASYFRDADYPADAMVRGEVGHVAFTIQVAPDGGVAGCRVTASSGSQSLDQGTCRILTERARFTPARNAAGEAVADEVTGQITWALPSEPTGARARADLSSYIWNNDYPREALRRHEQGIVEFELDVSPVGRVTNCRVMRSSGSRQLDLRTCQAMIVRARFEPARDADRHPVADTVSGSIRWQITDY
ncbi:MAG TPA: energy transducer TonB [Allosphingosinicella sp.]